MDKREWPADKVERRKVAELVPCAQNARLHSPEQVAQIAASIERWGFTTPILLDEADEIIAGHGRVLALKKLGAEEAPCMVASGWSEEERRAYRIADNKLQLNGAWDDGLLKVELSELGESGFDLGLIGFSASELDDLFVQREPKNVEFKAFDENIKTEHECPRCKYRWSGKPS